MTTFAAGLICDEKLMLPDFRVAFHQERPDWERGRLESVHERLKPGMRVYDLGAEHGDMTALYRSWGADVVPVEPSPPYWSCIRRTFEANGFDPPSAWYSSFAADVTHRGEGDFGTDGWPKGSLAPVIPDFGFRHLAQDKDTPRITIDDLAALTGPPDALMIDVEGAEHAVLTGARSVLAAGNVLVWVSVHEPTMLDWYGRTLDNLLALMASVGYAGELLPGHGEAETVFPPPGCRVYGVPDHLARTSGSRYRLVTVHNPARGPHRRSDTPAGGRPSPTRDPAFRSAPRLAIGILTLRVDSLRPARGQTP